MHKSHSCCIRSTDKQRRRKQRVSNRSKPIMQAPSGFSFIPPNPVFTGFSTQPKNDIPVTVSALPNVLCTSANQANSIFGVPGGLNPGLNVQPLPQSKATLPALFPPKLKEPEPVALPLSATSPFSGRDENFHYITDKVQQLELDKNHQAAEKQQEKAENSLYGQYEEKVRPCIDLIDSLRTLGVEKDLPLPAIAVIGDQSSGKSSVLEALSGVALPRGSGIVTRCPLVLKLKKTAPEHGWKGKISYLGINEVLQNPAQVEKEIRKAQDAMAGEGAGISHELISLEISSQGVPDLTLIDLPGITRVAVGNQPEDIGEQIKKLIKRIITKQETINLVVVPSNVDIATTEALKMAQEVDPLGERTLGILTKPDLVDKGTEEAVVDIVRNLVIHLKKGYMVVKCRGQQDIQNDLSLDRAIQKERKFFQDHEYFSVLLDERKATIPLLAEKLTAELVLHINKNIPRLEDQISEELQKSSQELRKYGKGAPKTDGEKLFFLIDKIKLFNQDIVNSVHGEEKVSGNEIRLFTKVRKEFQKWGKALDESSVKIQKVIHHEVWRFESQYRGRELPGFINYRTFEDIVKQQIKELEEPAVDILKTVVEIVRQHFTVLAKAHFDDFYNLNRAAKNRIEDIREKQAEAAETMIRTQFKMEQMVYCQDNVYSEDLKSIREDTAEQATGKTVTPKFKKFDFGTTALHNQYSVKEMAYHLEAYFNGAGNRLSSQIPLIIRSFVLQDYGDNLQNVMMQLLQEKAQLGFLLEERKEAADQRNFLSERIRRLTKARQHLVRFSVL
ncbi:PREDICTED: interferon-induced GTP-binding protein Mx1-like isoform X2 [Gavialis gangeticus]|uniref:interferon-induced GTP-binding protein Mx1-like isoform X2 n=1 Tax=Gavialis gangeticus TaxID=94835 RepID=UPI00092E1FEC|nr:PREDICTED: interferon-induced GTP-binding protein Mx1-like isoform X2 [Gavialis gangeticus]